MGADKRLETNNNQLFSYSVMLKVNDYKVSKICGKL